MNFLNHTVTWSPGMKLDQLEESAIKKAMIHFQGNKTATANSLGIAVRTLDNKLKIYEDRDKEYEKRQDDQREKDREFLARSRGLVVSSDTRTDDNKPVDNPSAGNAVPVPKSGDVQEVLPSQVTSFRKEGRRK